MAGIAAMQLDALLKQEFWQQELVAFQNAFWSMSLLFVAVAVAVWWVRGQVNDREIGGLKGEISTKNGEISLLERQLKDAANGLDRAKDDLANLKKEFQAYKAAVAAEGSNASSTKVDAAIVRVANGNTHMGSFGSRAYSFGHVSNSEGCFGIRGPRSEPDCVTRPVSEHDQPHIRSPLETAVPTSRLRRAGAINRHVGPWLPSVRPPGSARTDQVLGDLIIC